ncbi:HEXXH motif-containing protein [Streptomyces misionensis]|uniref:HEXXH motif-containing protein n=1 Tax=Streptomyces misionensis TaxID=67331 RepID=A0A1H4IA87_9ACTN|nr:HEXXH motif-containing protein [Streptomyces misionensis]
MSRIPVNLRGPIETVQVSLTGTQRLSAIYHRNVAQRLVRALPLAEGESCQLECLMARARSVQWLSPEAVHRLYQLPRYPLHADDQPWLSEVLYQAALATPSATPYTGPKASWIVNALRELIEPSANEYPVVIDLPRRLRVSLEIARRAFSLAWPEAWAEHNLLVKYLVFIDAQPMRSATHQTTFGAVYLEANAAEDPLNLFLDLVHETGHHALALRDQFAGFLKNPDALSEHPLRPGARPLRGVLHAAFVLWRMAEALRRYDQVAPRGGPLDGHPWQTQHAELAEQLLAVLQRLDADAQWTDSGLALRRSLTENCQKIRSQVAS